MERTLRATPYCTDHSRVLSNLLLVLVFVSGFCTYHPGSGSSNVNFPLAFAQLLTLSKSMLIASYSRNQRYQLKERHIMTSDLKITSVS